jgi:hypothetical protein
MNIFLICGIALKNILFYANYQNIYAEALLALVLLPAPASGSQDEVYGRVFHMVVGDTFDLEIEILQIVKLDV